MELSRGEGQVKRRSPTEKLRKICLMKVNEAGLEGKRARTERAELLSK